MVSEKEMSNYFTNVLNIIKPVTPALIYLRKNDVEASINEIWKIRGNDFKTYCIEYDSKTIYSQVNNLHGDDATIELWKNYQDLTDKLFIDFPFMKIRVVTDQNNWDNIYNDIFSFLADVVIY